MAWSDRGTGPGCCVRVVATVRSVDAVEEPMVNVVAAVVRERFGRPVTLEIVTLPVVRSEN